MASAKGLALNPLEFAVLPEPEMVEIILRRAKHTEPAMRITQREGNRPRDLRQGGDPSVASQLTLLVALPILNTDDSSRCTGLLRAPTMRSVPETEFANVSRDSWRMRSTPSSSATERAIDSTVSPAVNLRLRKLLMAKARIIARPC